MLAPVLKRAVGAHRVGVPVDLDLVGHVEARVLGGGADLHQATRLDSVERPVLGVDEGHGERVRLQVLADELRHREVLEVLPVHVLAPDGLLPVAARSGLDGGAGDEWIKALEPIGTDADKPHLDIAPWLIVIFAQRWGTFNDGTRYKHYYVPESVGIATGLLITALHHAGLSTLTHTPNPMKFLNGILNRPEAEKPVMILAVGHPAEDATVPAVAKIKKPLEEILSVFEDQE